MSPRPFRGVWKFSKLGSSTWLKINFRQQNSLTFPWLLEICCKFPDFQRSLPNSLTFPGFPGQWQPCMTYKHCTSKSSPKPSLSNIYCVYIWLSARKIYCLWGETIGCCFYCSFLCFLISGGNNVLEGEKSFGPPPPPAAPAAESQYIKQNYRPA